MVAPHSLSPVLIGGCHTTCPIYFPAYMPYPPVSYIPTSPSLYFTNLLPKMPETLCLLYPHLCHLPPCVLLLSPLPTTHRRRLRQQQRHHRVLPSPTPAPVATYLPHHLSDLLPPASIFRHNHLPSLNAMTKYRYPTSIDG